MPRLRLISPVWGKLHHTNRDDVPDVTLEYPALNITNKNMIHLARLLIASLFILGGINKIFNYGAVLDSMESAGLPLVSVLLPLTILLELAGGALVAIGARFHVQAALVLAVFTVATNIVFHAFWGMAGSERAVEISLFFKNIVVVGALLHIAAVGMNHDEGR